MMTLELLRFGARASCAFLLALPAALGSPPAQEEQSAPADEFTALAREHYRRVGIELGRRDTSHLGPAQRAARAAMLAALERYSARGDFGRNADFPGARVPYFVDLDGRRCAVAELLHVSGEDGIVARVNRGANHAFIIDLAGDAELACWLEEVGLELHEAARIQIPTGGPRQGPPGPGPSGPPPVSPGPPPTYGGPGGPAAPAAPSSPGPAGPAAPAPRNPGTGGKRADLPDPGGPSTGGDDLDPWWQWWEMNKLDYLRPNHLSYSAGPVTGYDLGLGIGSDLAGRARAVLALRLVDELEHDSADVRAAAAVALARLRGPESVAFLRRLLKDPSAKVREHTLLAIGAAGGQRAEELLLSVLGNGSESEGRPDAISPRAQALAWVGLGLARRRGAQGVDEQVLLDALRSASRKERETLELAAMLHQTLAPSEALVGVAKQLAQTDGARAQSRARALETLGRQRDEEALGTLSRALHGRRLDLRQSAALALGGFHHDVALPTLKTAFELERESTTRGFVLLAIGRRGGEGAREFLTEALADERRSLGPWAALALGILARSSDDDLCRSALRGALPQVANAAHRGAYLLALGIARDREAVPALGRELESPNQLTRMHAALGLGMIGSSEARDVLLARLAFERSDLVRVGIVHGLGAIGDGRDGRVLVEALAELGNADLQPLMSVAVAFHGSREVLDGLVALSERESLSSTARAGVWNSLGMLLGIEPSLELAELSKNSNFLVFPDWVHDLLQVTL